MGSANLEPLTETGSLQMSDDSEKSKSPIKPTSKPTKDAVSETAPIVDGDIQRLLLVASAQNVSDIHLRVGLPPMFRRYGKIIQTNFPEISPQSMQQMAQWLIPERLYAQLKEKRDLDFGVTWNGQRLRVNMLFDMGKMGFVIRLIRSNIPELINLNLPHAIETFPTLNSGLVLFTGPTGCGKSTSLAAIIEQINMRYQKHIVTIEDPAEFIYTSKKSLITQRQLGIDTDSYSMAIRQALRQNPDVMLIGELRDRETAFSAMKAAETGILVFATLHTPDAVQTVNRLIHMFEPDEQPAIRDHLAHILRAVVSQRLYHPLNTEEGRAAVAEVVLVTNTVRDYLIRNEMETLYRLVDESRLGDMQSMNSALYSLYKNHQISMEEALELSNNPISLQNRFQGIYHGTSSMEFQDF